uniref:YaiI/YqxD family protein n=1 Tax=Leeia oryzae TaxID=356662 RepID=UPI000378E426
MCIWVDADACPNVIKDILFRAADRWQVRTTLVANRLLRVPPSSYLFARQVPAGFDVADNWIVQHAEIGDLVITADIPLAALIIEKQAHALNPRGEFYSPENIREKLAMRDFMESLRSSGIETGGPSALNQSDRQAFASQLDKFLNKYAMR